jgi:biotin/methionine sulfoxide reductase
MLEAFRANPDGSPLSTPSGRIEIFSETLASFGNADCQGPPAWLEPREWLGNASSDYPLHLLSPQPSDKLHSQLDASSVSRGKKVHGREPLAISPNDARSRGIADGDIVRVSSARGSCFAAAVVQPGIRDGVVAMATGAWLDPVSWEQPGIDKHGNPNVLTADRPASALSQGCAAQSCLVQVEKVAGEVPPVTAFEPPELLAH